MCFALRQFVDFASTGPPPSGLYFPPTRPTPAQVAYGFLELKTHAKVTLVVRREGESLRSYGALGVWVLHPVRRVVRSEPSGG
jgi:hypothetical protein